jgi:hypothetical protein
MRPINKAGPNLDSPTNKGAHGGGVPLTSRLTCPAKNVSNVLARSICNTLQGFMSWKLVAPALSTDFLKFSGEFELDLHVKV